MIARLDVWLEQMACDWAHTDEPCGDSACWLREPPPSACNLAPTGASIEAQPQRAYLVTVERGDKTSTVEVSAYTAQDAAFQAVAETPIYWIGASDKPVVPRVRKVTPFERAAVEVRPGLWRATKSTSIFRGQAAKAGEASCPHGAERTSSADHD